jgi:ribosomal protein L11 methyltransferase
VSLPGYKIELVAPSEDAAERFAAALEPFADAVSAFELAPGGAWRVEAYAAAAPEPARLAAALRDTATGGPAPPHHVAPLPAVDWLAENRRDFPPLALGRFFIHGSHFQGRVPAGRFGLLIDAATAFGSGEHDTTRLCLAALERLQRRRRIAKPLDLGCGSGILSLAAGLLWRVPVLGSDLDPESVRVARDNARLNRLAGLVRIVQGDGYRAPAIRRRAPFDLIVANILARPLCRLAPALARHLAPGGVAILSGLLIEQETQVLAAHRNQGLALIGRLRSPAWAALMLRRRPL